MSPFAVRRRRKASTLVAAGVAATMLAAFLNIAAVQPAHAAQKPKISAKITHRTLVIDGTNGDDNITLRLKAGNSKVIEVYASSPTTRDFRFRVARFDSISISGGDGNDTITLDESNGPLASATIDGGAGNDTIHSGSGNDALLGGPGNDTIDGGAGNDTITGGPGADSSFGGAGNDTMIWNAGDGSDLNEGGDGTDTTRVNGSNNAETFAITQNGTRERFDRTDASLFFIDIGTTENLDLKMNGGNDSFSATGNLAGAIALNIDGGAGDDTILGGNGADILTGGDGNDFIDGKQGADTVFMGNGDDTFQWDPGDGSDIVEGQAGNDTMLFNGANVNEKFDLSANGQRTRLFRDVASITMDFDGIENVTLKMLGGVDTLTVNNLAGTAVNNVNVDLSANGAPDGAADSVIVNGTDAADVITVKGDATSVSVSGLQAKVSITGAETANDRLTVNAAAGDDVIEATGLTAAAIQLTENGGDGNDLLIGGQGDDTLNGNAGDDVLEGGPGQDILNGAPGNDVLIQ